MGQLISEWVVLFQGNAADHFEDNFMQVESRVCMHLQLILGWENMERMDMKENDVQELNNFNQEKWESEVDAAAKRTHTGRWRIGLHCFSFV